MLGKNLGLGQYRAEFLRSHGYEVIFPQSKQEAIARIRSGGFDSVILSYTLSDRTVQEVRDLLDQECPKCRTIALTENRWEDRRVPSDAVVLVSDGPEALLRTVKNIGLDGLLRVK